MYTYITLREQAQVNNRAMLVYVCQVIASLTSLHSLVVQAGSGIGTDR